MSRVPLSPVLLLAAALGGAALAQANTSSSTRPGGANQRVSVEGCAGEWLFNGVWRLRVLSVARGEEYRQPLWQVRLELRNGVDRNITPSSQGGISSYKTQLISSTGNTLNMAPLESATFDRKVSYKNLPPGGSVSYTARFRADAEDMAAPPSKLLMNVNIGPLAKNLPWGKNPSFRVRLDCRR